MRILVDADSCYSVPILKSIGKKNNLEVHLFFDPTHEYNEEENLILHVVDKGRDSADFSILKFCQKGDIIVTKDGGLAAMGLAKKCYVVNSNGRELTNDIIDDILISRHITSRERRKGNRIKARKNNEKIHFNIVDTIANIIKRDKEGGKNNNESSI